MLRSTILIAAWFALASPIMAAETSYPDRPIRLVIGSAPGSGPDIIARVLSERLYKAWQQRIVVDARPGLAGAISAEIVTRAAPDGYTWLMMTSQLFIATKVYKDLKFDLERDFASIALIGTVPYVLVVNPTLPVKSVSDLIQYSKKTPLRHGSAGPGGGEHLCMVYFLHMADTKMLHVPYKGIAQALGDVAGNEIHTTFAVVPAALPFVQGKRVRPLGVTSTKRSPLASRSARASSAPEGLSPTAAWPGRPRSSTSSWAPGFSTVIIGLRPPGTGPPCPAGSGPAAPAPGPTAAPRSARPAASRRARPGGRCR